MYNKYSADRVVAEINQGGAMVENTLRMVDKSVAYRPVHASKGKITRAEPVSALFEQGRVSFVGAFPQLEDQLTSFEPGSTGSPDRLDAMVYALTELMVDHQPGTPFVGHYWNGFASPARGVMAGPPTDWFERGDLFAPFDFRYRLAQGAAWVAKKLAAGEVTEQLARERGWIK